MTTMSIKINEESVKQSAASSQETAQARAGEAEKLVVKTHAEYQSVADLLFDVKEQAKDVKAERDKALKPAKEIIDTVTKWFAPALGYLEKAEDSFKEAIRTYKVASEKAQAAELQKASNLQRLGQTDKAMALVARADEKLAPEVKGISFTGKFEISIVNEADVPEDFWTRVIDFKKLQAAVDQGARAIPGVAVVDKRTVSVYPGRRVKED